MRANAFGEEWDPLREGGDGLGENVCKNERGRRDGEYDRVAGAVAVLVKKDGGGRNASQSS